MNWVDHFIIKWVSWWVVINITKPSVSATDFFFLPLSVLVSDIPSLKFMRLCVADQNIDDNMRSYKFYDTYLYGVKY